MSRQRAEVEGGRRLGGREEDICRHVQPCLSAELQGLGIRLPSLKLSCVLLAPGGLSWVAGWTDDCYKTALQE